MGFRREDGGYVLSFTTLTNRRKVSPCQRYYLAFDIKRYSRKARVEEYRWIDRCLYPKRVEDCFIVILLLLLCAR